MGLLALYHCCLNISIFIKCYKVLHVLLFDLLKQYISGGVLYDKMLQIEWAAPIENLPQLAMCAPPPGLMAIRHNEVEFFCPVLMS